MRVFVTGGTGYVGPAIVREVLRQGHEVTLLVHRHAGPFTDEDARVRIVRGDVTKEGNWVDDVAGHEAVIHLVALRRAFPKRGLTFERFNLDATRNVVAAAEAHGVPRYLHMSASGAKPEGTAYHRTKWEAEELVQASGLKWTIFRPTFITGPAEKDGDGFDQEFANIVRKTPVLPGFGGGKFPLQPVAKRDVAKAFANALTRPESVGKTYLLAGPTRLTWNEYLRTLAGVLGKRRVVAPVPAWFILPVAGALDRFAWFPASRDELRMLMEGHAGDGSAAARDLGFEYSPYEDALRAAVAPDEPERDRASGGRPAATR